MTRKTTTSGSISRRRLLATASAGAAIARGRSAISRRVLSSGITRIRAETPKGLVQFNFPAMSTATRATARISDTPRQNATGLRSNSGARARLNQAAFGWRRS